jgi:hypothetical protein
MYILNTTFWLAEFFLTCTQIFFVIVKPGFNKFRTFRNHPLYILNTAFWFAVLFFYVVFVYLFVCFRTLDNLKDILKMCYKYRLHNLIIISTQYKDVCPFLIYSPLLPDTSYHIFFLIWSRIFKISPEITRWTVS